MKQRRKREAEWPEALVTAPLPPAPAGLDLPNPDDWPIIATAIIGRASTTLTYDRGHFPHRVLGPYGLHVRHPDRWCAALVRSADDVAADVYAGLRDHLADLRKPARDPGDLTVPRADSINSRTETGSCHVHVERQTGFARRLNRALRQSAKSRR